MSIMIQAFEQFTRHEIRLKVFVLLFPLFSKRYFTAALYYIELHKTKNQSITKRITYKRNKSKLYKYMQLTKT